MEYLLQLGKDGEVINSVKHTKKHILSMKDSGIDMSGWVKVDHFDPEESYKYIGGELIILSDLEKEWVIRGEIVKRLNFELHKEAQLRIQTIPAQIRSSVLGRKKERLKTYMETWQNFYQKCQNIRFDQDVIHELEARKAATWVVQRIDKIVCKRDALKKSLEKMTLQELKQFDPLNAGHWDTE